MILSDSWQEYRVLDCGGGEKLERWGRYTLRRPDPQAIWPRGEHPLWEKADAVYERSASGGGAWHFNKTMPEQWFLPWGNLRFVVRPTGFKHTGLFPEQAANWQWMMDQAAQCKTPLRVLNLFGYTGGATVALTAAGAHVTHVDAAKGMVERAKLNCKLSGIGEKNVRWIVEDCKKFIEREIRRGSTYGAVIMDPPSYGRGASGEVWKLEDSLFELIELSARILSKNPLFFLLNSYTTGLGASVMKNLLEIALKPFKGSVKAYELCLPTEEEGIVLPCGNSALWQCAVRC